MFFRSRRSDRIRRRMKNRLCLESLEGLEERLVMTGATPMIGLSLAHPIVTAVGGHLVNTTPVTVGSSSSSSVAPPVIHLSHPANSPSETFVTIDLLEYSSGVRIYANGAQTDVQPLGGGPVTHFTTASTNSVSIFYTGSSTAVVDIDASGGMPFTPGTTVSLSSSPAPGTAVLELGGGRPLSGNETYVAGGAPWTPGSLQVANVTFKFDSSVPDVIDSLPITGTLDVQTSGTGVQLASFPYYGFGGEELYGMGAGGGDFLEYSNKPTVTLETYAQNASVFLDATGAAAGESYFTVNMHAAGDSATIDETPKNVQTFVNIDPPDTNAKIALWGNYGPVTIDGDSSTDVMVGYPVISNGLITGYITQGIEAKVAVEGASGLVVDDSGNVTNFEFVTVTDNTISGTGLFGNSGVTLEYGGIEVVDILTGQLADGYTVAPSSPNAVFTSALTIDSNSYMAFHVNVDVDAASNLDLTLFNRQPQKDAGGVLDVKALGRPGGIVRLSGTHPNGTVAVSFADHPTSRIFYNGFNNVS